MSYSYVRKLSTALFSLLLSAVAASMQDLIDFNTFSIVVLVEKCNNKDCDTLASIRLGISHPDTVIFKPPVPAVVDWK